MSDASPDETPRVAVLMGSNSDWPVMKRTVAALDELGVANEAKVISAHRKGARLREYMAEAEAKGIRVYIAGAGLAAHLPGVVASLTTRPVLGVPLEAGPLKGEDALLSIVQMPGGIPVGTLAIGGAGAKNAGILAAQILATSDDELAVRVKNARQAAADGLAEEPSE